MTIAEHTVDSRKLVIGDVHGCSKTFRHLVGEVVKLTRKDTLVLLGDYINKGPDSKSVLDFIIELKKDGFEVIAMKGNHEELLLQAWNGNDKAREEWLGKGGEATLESFGVTSPDDIPDQYKEKIKRMGYYLEMDEAFIVHAGFNFEIEDPYEDKDAMLNIRNYKPDLNFLKGKKIIHGHSPITLDEVKKQILENNPVINIDAGCAFPEKEGKGHLVAIELGSWKLYETKNIDELVHQ